MTKVKVGKITNLSEARYCAGMGVDFLSFPIPVVDPKTYKEITGWIAGPEFGVAVDAAGAQSLSEYNAQFIEVSAEEAALFRGGSSLLVTLPISHWPSRKSALLAQAAQIRFVELEVARLDDASEKLIRDAVADFDVLIRPSANIDLRKLIQLPIAGVSLEGNAETRPGLKEYPLAEILERIEED